MAMAQHLDDSGLPNDWFHDAPLQLPSPPPLPFLDSSPLQQHPTNDDDFWSHMLPSTPIFAAEFSDSFGFDFIQHTAGSTCVSDNSAAQLEFGHFSPSNEVQSSGSDYPHLLHPPQSGDDFEPEMIPITIGPADYETTTISSNPSEASESENLRNSRTHCGGAKKRVYSNPYEDGDMTVVGSFDHKKPKISSPQSVLDEAEDDHHQQGPIPGPVSAKQQCGIKPHHHQNQAHNTQIYHQSRATRTSHSSSHNPKESRWAEQLLGACATAIANNNILRTQHLMWVLNDLASFSGDVNQRLAAFGLKALFSRVTGAISLPPTPPLPVDANNSSVPLPVHHALLRFDDASPWHRTVYTIANGALLEAFEGLDTVHIVDIGVSQGTQWPTFIESLATRPSGAPKLMRLTTVQDPSGSFLSGGQHVQGSGRGSAEFLARLEPFARKLGLKLELRNVCKPLESLTRDDLELGEGMALAICAQFRLHHISEELPNVPIGEELETAQICPRNAFLKFIHGLQPETVVLSENNADHSSSDFLTLFLKAMEFHWTFLDSTSASFKGKNCEERHIIEAEAGLRLINNVAFEGAARTERNETHRGWSSRMRNTGFCTSMPSTEVLEHAKSLLRKHNGHWDLLMEDECMVLRWKNQPATFCSVWRPSTPPDPNLQT